MTGKFFVSIIACLSMWLWVGTCIAEEHEYKGEVFGVVGVSGVHDDESYLGSGVDFGGGLGLRLARRVGAEIEVDRVSFSRDFSSGVHFGGDAVTFGGNVQFYFPIAKTEPYVFGGAGMVHFHETNRSPVEEGPANFEGTDNALAIQVGGGVRFFAGPRVSLRPEFRWTTSKISFINQLRGSVSVGFHW